MHNSVYMD